MIKKLLTLLLCLLIGALTLNTLMFAPTKQARQPYIGTPIDDGAKLRLSQSIQIKTISGQDAEI